jgi:hypothetical protein
MSNPQDDHQRNPGPSIGGPFFCAVFRIITKQDRGKRLDDWALF